VEGSWLVTHQDDPGGNPTKVKAVSSFSPGGVLFSVDIAPTGPPSAGSWASTGPGRFKATFWFGAPSGGPTDPAVTVQVRLRGRMSGDKISGTDAFTVRNAETDEPVFSGTWQVLGKAHPGLIDQRTIEGIETSPASRIGLEP
jgi:hypothetical protein